MKAQDIPEIPKGQDFEESRNTLNEFIDSWNTFNKRISLKDNLSGQIIEKITIPAGEEKVIPHLLGTVPLYRVILRQEGNGVVSDVPSDWNKNSIKLINHGAESVTLTLMLARE